MSSWVAIAAKKSNPTICLYRVCDTSVISSLSGTAKSSKISIGVEDNRVVLVMGARSLQIYMIYAFYESRKALFERSRIL